MNDPKLLTQIRVEYIRCTFMSLSLEDLLVDDWAHYDLIWHIAVEDSRVLVVDNEREKEEKRLSLWGSSEGERFFD